MIKDSCDSSSLCNIKSFPVWVMYVYTALTLLGYMTMVMLIIHVYKYTVYDLPQ